MVLFIEMSYQPEKRRLKYVILHTGLIFIVSAIICKFKKGRAAAEQFAARCQQIGAFSLQNLFRLFPIILTWLGSGCLIGWLMWPKF